MALAVLCVATLRCNVAGTLASLDLAPGWRDESGRSDGMAVAHGHPAVVVPFVTSCMARCAPTIEKMKRLDATFAATHEKVDIVLFTVAPDHDRQEQLKDFKLAHQLPATWRLLRGDPETTSALANQLALPAEINDAEMDRSVRIGLFDAAGTPLRIYDSVDFDERDAAELLARSP